MTRIARRFGQHEKRHQIQTPPSSAAHQSQLQSHLPPNIKRNNGPHNCDQRLTRCREPKSARACSLHRPTDQIRRHQHRECKSQRHRNPSTHPHALQYTTRIVACPTTYVRLQWFQQNSINIAVVGRGRRRRRHRCTRTTSTSKGQQTAARI